VLTVRATLYSVALEASLLRSTVLHCAVLHCAVLHCAVLLCLRDATRKQGWSDVLRLRDKSPGAGPEKRWGLSTGKPEP